MELGNKFNTVSNIEHDSCNLTKNNNESNDIKDIQLSQENSNNSNTKLYSTFLKTIREKMAYAQPKVIDIAASATSSIWQSPLPLKSFLWQKESSAI